MTRFLVIDEPELELKLATRARGALARLAAELELRVLPVDSPPKAMLPDAPLNREQRRARIYRRGARR